MRSFVLFFAVLVSGCASVHSIHPDEAGEVEVLHDRLSGKVGRIDLVDGTHRTGSIVFVREDSTALLASDGYETVPTADIVRITRHRQTQHVRIGVLVGAGVGIAFAFAALASDDTSLGGPSRLAIGLMAPGALAAGLGLGTVESRRRVYVLRR